ncbi:MAG: hypothetical protein GXY77_09790 [Fibrobacter sp.]|nr:hypothetical protein [Fibrobacter sp.]
MFRSEKEIHGISVHAVDGLAGKVDQLVFDDRNWAIRYIVVDIGSWLSVKRVLISPAAIKHITKDRLYTRNSGDQIKNSKPFERIELVSRQEERELHEYYSWPFYWSYPQTYNSLGAAIYPGLSPPPFNQSEHLITREALKKDSEKEQKTRKSHLRETKEIRGYTIQATDEEYGSVVDFIIDDTLWVIRYLVISEGFIHPSKHLVAPQWTGGIDWGESTVYVLRDRKTIENSPPYNPELPVDRDYENMVYDHFKGKKYWEE